MEPIVVRFEGKDKYQRLLGGAPDTLGMKSGSMMLKPGESVGEHSTGPKEEALVILEGRGEVLFSGRPLINVEEDMFVYIPPDTAHDVRNTGESILRYIYVVK